MSTNSPIVQSNCAGTSDRDADVEAVLEQLVSGKPIAPDVLARVRTRAEKITADVKQDYGLLDDHTFQSLLDDEQ